jgi:dipeptidyl aminopeptidase/acylaminoacyl peptidase
VPLLDNGTAVAVTPSGHLLFTRDDALMAAPFDARSGAVGSPTALSESVMVMDYGVAQLAVSASGTLAYVPPPGANSPPVVGWLSPSGMFTDIGPLPLGVDRAAVSPDGSRAVVSQFGTDRVFVMDLVRRVTTPLSLRGRQIESVAWHPDGKRLTLGGLTLTLLDPETGRDVLLAPDGAPKRDPSWTPDGHSVLYQTFDPGAAIHMLTLDASGEKVTAAPRRLLPADSQNLAPAVSPDGHWMAYQSQPDPAGRSDIYVARYPDGSGRIQVTANGGSRPFWNPNGSQLYFTGRPGVLQAASIRIGATLEVGAVRTLFPLRDVGSISVAKDGRLLAIRTPPSVPPQRIVVVQHWMDELTRAVPR